MGLGRRLPGGGGPGTEEDGGADSLVEGGLARGGRGRRLPCWRGLELRTRDRTPGSQAACGGCDGVRGQDLGEHNDVFHL